MRGGWTTDVIRKTTAVVKRSIIIRATPRPPFHRHP
jgi:hypothetical protein